MTLAIQYRKLKKHIRQHGEPASVKSPPTRPTSPTTKFHYSIYLKINYIYVVSGLGICWAVLGALGSRRKKLGELGGWGAVLGNGTPCYMFFLIKMEGCRLGSKW